MNTSPSEALTRAPVTLAADGFIDQLDIDEVRGLVDAMLGMARVGCNDALNSLMEDLLVSSCLIGQAYQITHDGLAELSNYGLSVFSPSGIYRLLQTLDLNSGLPEHLETIENELEQIGPLCNQNLINAFDFFRVSWPNYPTALKHSTVKILRDRLIGFSAGADHCILQ